MSTMDALFDGSDAHELPRSATHALVAAMRILAAEIQSDDGVANAAIAEAAARLDELAALLREASGPMSYGHWSTDFRERVERAISA